MQILSLVWGILAMGGLFIGFIPCLGSLNWLNVPFAAIGLVVSIVAMSTVKDGNRSHAIAGTVCCGLAVVLGIVRLVVGGGLI